MNYADFEQTAGPETVWTWYQMCLKRCHAGVCNWGVNNTITVIETRLGILAASKSITACWSDGKEPLTVAQ
jgi:hypothetical protein